jgi:hypothetical protein
MSRVQIAQLTASLTIYCHQRDCGGTNTKGILMYIKDKKSQPSGVKIVTLTGCLGYPKESVRMTTDTKPVAKEIFNHIST